MATRNLRAKLAKAKALANDSGATEGERRAAEKAQERLEVAIAAEAGAEEPGGENGARKAKRAPRTPRRDLDTRGVSWFELKGRGWTCRWSMPVPVHKDGRDTIGYVVKQASARSLDCRNEAERQAWAVRLSAQLREARRSILAGDAPRAGRLVADAVDEALRFQEAATTKANRKVVLRRFQDWLAAKRIVNTRGITDAVLAEWRDSLEAEGSTLRKASSRNKWLDMVGTWLRWARGRGWLDQLKGMDLREVLKRWNGKSDAAEVRWLPPDQLQQLLRVALALGAESPKEPIAELVLTVIGTGARISEIINLHWSEVYEDRIVLPKARTKTRMGRKITLWESPSVARLLQAMRLRAGSSARVFPGLDRTTTTSWMQRLHRNGAPPETHWHALRRSACTLLAYSTIYAGVGDSLMLTAARAGHAATMCERLYASRATVRLPAGKTIEEVAGIVELAEEVVRRAGGVVEPQQHAAAM